jgi:outer membrane protein
MRSASILLLALAVSVAAQARPKVAILNIQRAIKSTQDAKAAAAELQRKFAPDQEKLSTEQREIDELETQFQGSTARSEDETRLLRSRIDDLTRTHRRHVEDARSKFDQEQRRVLAELGAKIITVVKQLAKQNHFEVVLDESQASAVLWRADNADITDEVIKRYNIAQRKK